MSDCGHDKLDEVILTGLVDVSVPEISPVTCRSLMKFGRGVGGLVVSSHRCRQEDRGLVEAIMRSGDELLFDRLRR